MTRIRPLADDEASPESRHHFAKDRAANGTVMPSTGLHAYCPPILDAVKALGPAIEQSGRLSRELRCLLNVRAASMVGCPF